MIRSVFISRDLDNDSPFRGILEDKGLMVSGESFITIRPHPFKTVPSANWIFFYSKNGVNHFLGQLSKIQKEQLPSQIATIGSATARALEPWGIKPTFIGNGNAKGTAEMFAEIALGQIVLFPRAQNSRRSVQEELDDDIQSIDLVVYTNEIKENLPNRNEDVLVFTSPLNAKAYFQNHRISDLQKIIAIGLTTGECLKELGYSEFFIADNPSEASLGQLVAQLLQ